MTSTMNHTKWLTEQNNRIQRAIAHDSLMAQLKRLKEGGY